MLGPVPPTTCLSPAVHNMVCVLGFEMQDHVEMRSILDQENRVRWRAIWERVSYLSSGVGLDYAESVRQLGPLCDAAHGHFMSLSNENYEETFHDWFQWTNNCEVYLIIGKDCPFLLRDLLASQELAKIFSQSVMNVLRVFLGSPLSLNLRNILWHGFASPHEIPPKYCSMLL
ncbi:hypothetical protein GDO78_020305, partial [Eleutherodactylus coqui]